MATKKTLSNISPRARRPSSPAPHSWDYGTWPADVWPHNSSRAQWIGRAYRQNLQRAGAVVRVGYMVPPAPVDPYEDEAFRLMELKAKLMS